MACSSFRSVVLRGQFCCVVLAHIWPIYRRRIFVGLPHDVAKESTWEQNPEANVRESGKAASCVEDLLPGKQNLAACVRTCCWSVKLTPCLGTMRLGRPKYVFSVRLVVVSTVASWRGLSKCAREEGLRYCCSLHRSGNCCVCFQWRSPCFLVGGISLYDEARRAPLYNALGSA